MNESLICRLLGLWQGKPLRSWWRKGPSDSLPLTRTSKFTLELPTHRFLFRIPVEHLVMKWWKLFEAFSLLAFWLLVTLLFILLSSTFWQLVHVVDRLVLVFIAFIDFFYISFYHHSFSSCSDFIVHDLALLGARDRYWTDAVSFTSLCCIFPNGLIRSRRFEVEHCTVCSILLLLLLLAVEMCQWNAVSVLVFGPVSTQRFPTLSIKLT